MLLFRCACLPLLGLRPFDSSSQAPRRLCSLRDFTETTNTLDPHTATLRTRQYHLNHRTRSNLVYAILLTSTPQSQATMASVFNATIPQSEPGFSFSQAPSSASQPRQHAFYPYASVLIHDSLALTDLRTDTQTTAAQHSESVVETSPS